MATSLPSLATSACTGSVPSVKAMTTGCTISARVTRRARIERGAHAVVRTLLA
ncbi:hypothetical protein ACGF4C_22495 [Streptomyces sp. NPDC048197]|uniref:hypothetical protein n=1 Tax=Streptomyces sp. NPDC048197 TaxID=3365511 RepID=UPI0037177EF4